MSTCLCVSVCLSVSLNSMRVRHHLAPCTQRELRGKKTCLSVSLLWDIEPSLSHLPVCSRATRLFCDVYNLQSQTYCKRLQVLCPEHSRDPKVRHTDRRGDNNNIANKVSVRLPVCLSGPSRRGVWLSSGERRVPAHWRLLPSLKEKM